MLKYTGRFYVSSLIVFAALDAAKDAVVNTWIWFIVFAHLFCLFFVIKDGVE